jgi:hypothetical protein
MLRRSRAQLAALVSRLAGPAAPDALRPAGQLGHVCSSSGAAAPDAERASSNASASTSYGDRCAAGARAAPQPSPHRALGGQQLRGYARPAVPPMPEHIARLILPEDAPPKERHVPPPEPRPYTRDSKRTGVIAIKAGMTQEWDEWGVRVPLTVLWIDACEVVRVKTAAADGVDALVLGVGSKREKQLRKPQLGEYRSLGIAPKAKLAEFGVTPDALLPPGTKLGAGHFVAGAHRSAPAARLARPPPPGAGRSCPAAVPCRPRPAPPGFAQASTWT